MNKTNLVKICAIAGLMFGAASANAGLLCSGVDYSGDLSTTDVTFRGDNADDCYGEMSGNDSGAQGTGIDTLNAAFGPSWQSLLKDDSPGSGTADSGSFMDVNFSLSSTAGTSGDWTLSWEEQVAGALPLTMDFAAVLKSSTGYGIYFFDDELFTDETGNGTGTGNGTWEITFANASGGSIGAISHFSLYVREGTPPPPPSVPEPGTLFLMGLGLLGLARARKALV